MTVLDDSISEFEETENLDLEMDKYSTFNMLKSILSIMVPSMMTLLIAEMQW